MAFHRHALCSSICLLIVAGSITSCTSNETPNPFMDALPRIAVTSPTAQAIHPTRNAQVLANGFTVKAGVSPTIQPSFGNSRTGVKAGPESLDNQITALPEAAEIIRSMASGSVKKAMKRMHFEVKTSPVRCFGQGRPFTNHPDGGPNSSTRGGETGFESAVEFDNGVATACPAATMNQKVLALGGLVNQALALTFVAAAELHAQGRRLPQLAGETVGATLPTSESLVDSRVMVTRQSADKQAKKFLWNFVSTLRQSNLEVPVEFWLSHEKLAAQERGRIWGAIPQGAAWYAFSLAYQSDSNRTRYELRSANSMGTTRVASSAFSKEGELIFSAPGDQGQQQNLFFMVADLESQSGLGKMKAAWAASPTSPRSRVFEISTYTVPAGHDEGLSYFGYGPMLTQTAAATKDALTARSMVCAWSAGQKSFSKVGAQAERVGLVQAMKLVRNHQTGQFLPVPDTQRIAYCPTQSCNGGKEMTYGGKLCNGAHQLARAGEFGRISVDGPVFR